MTDENAEIDEYVKRYGGKVNANEEERLEVGAEAPERDNSVSALQPHAVGVPGVRRIERPGVQGPRSLVDDAFEAGEREGYAQGYIDGHDDGWDAAICLVRKILDDISNELEGWDDDIEHVVVIELTREALDRLERGELDV